jgi:hypothetical protein
MKLLFTLLVFGNLSTSVIGQTETNPEKSEPVTIRLVCYNRAGELPVSFSFRYKGKDKFISYKKLKDKNNLFEIFSPEDIQKISVVKGDEAIEKFGKYAGQGVIIIDLKDRADSKTWKKIKRYSSL